MTNSAYSYQQVDISRSSYCPDPLLDDHYDSVNVPLSRLGTLAPGCGTYQIHWVHFCPEILYYLMPHSINCPMSRTRPCHRLGVIYLTNKCPDLKSLVGAATREWGNPRKSRSPTGISLCGGPPEALPRVFVSLRARTPGTCAKIPLRQDVFLPPRPGLEVKSRY